MRHGSSFTDGIHSSGNIPERGHYPDGRKDTCAGKREHPPVCFSPGNDGGLFKYRHVKRIVRGINGRWLQPSDTPAAIVYKATWPEEKTVRTTVAGLAEAAERETYYKNSPDRSRKCSGTKWLRQVKTV